MKNHARPILRPLNRLFRTLTCAVVAAVFLALTVPFALAQQPATPDGFFLGDQAFSLTRTLEKDLNVATLEDGAARDLIPAALVYMDPDRRLDRAAVVNMYLGGNRPRTNQRNLLVQQTNGGAMWIVVPIYNRTGETNWVLDLGDRRMGRTAPFAALTVAEVTTNKTYVHHDASRAEAGFTFQAQKKMTQKSMMVDLKPQSYHLLVLRVIPDGPRAAVFPVRFSSSAGVPDRPLWQNETLYLAVAFLFSGVMLAAAFLSGRWGIGFFVIYMMALTLFALFPLPLVSGDGLECKLMMLMAIAMGLSLTLGALTIGHISGLHIQKVVLSVIALLVHLGVAAFVFLGLEDIVCHPFFMTGVAIPALLFSGVVAVALLREGQSGAMVLFGPALINGVAFGVESSASLQILPQNFLTQNAVLLSLFISGPVVLYLLDRINVFAESVDVQKRRRRSLNDEERLAQLRHAKENFDYNNLLKVIEHERKQLSDARAREHLRSEEMRKARDMADEANRAKSAFLAVISHEIRTPMTGIMGMVKLLLDTTLTKAQHEFVLTVKESGNAMMGLLNDILDFEKIETGKMQMEMLDFDLHRLISGVATLMNGHATTKGIALNVDLDPSVPQYVVGDMVRLRQILLNLVGNAVKFTTQGSVTIKVSASHNENSETKENTYQIYFAVIDTGIGISAQAQKNIFNPFAQADKSIARKFGGSGLGLAISKRLIEAMGSQINIKSREGEGTTFFFSLTMKEGDPVIAENQINRGTKTVQTAGLADLPSLRILVVEDNSVTQKVLRAMIEQARHNVLVCESAEEALPYLQMGERFDLILSDIQMDGMSGYEFTRAIRELEDPISRATPVYALTGNVDRDDIRACMEAGMNGHLAKPIDPQAFESVLVEAARAKQGDDKMAAEALFGGPGPAEQNVRDLSTPDPELDLLRTLRDSLGDEQINQLLQGFYDKAQEIIAVLTALPPDRLGDIRERAHELKGMAGNFGMMPLSDLAKKIEKQAKEGLIEGLADLVVKLPPTYETGRQKIENWMKV